MRERQTADNEEYRQTKLTADKEGDRLLTKRGIQTQLTIDNKVDTQTHSLQTMRDRQTADNEGYRQISLLTKRETACWQREGYRHNLLLTMRETETLSCPRSLVACTRYVPASWVVTSLMARLKWCTVLVASS